MKKLTLFAFLLFSCLAFAQTQAVRFGDGEPVLSNQTIPGYGPPFITGVSNAQINFCQAPANAVPCTNLATTYTDSTASTACSLSQQVVLDGTTTCVTTTDTRGNWGVWALPGQYAYTVTVSGTSYGPFFATLGGASGGGGGGTVIPGAANDVLASAGNSTSILVDTGKITINPTTHFLNAYGFQSNSGLPFILNGLPSGSACTAGPSGQVQYALCPGPLATLSYNSDGPFPIQRYGLIGSTATQMPSSTYMPLDSNGTMPFGSLGDVGWARINPGVMGLVNSASLTSPTRLNLYGGAGFGTNGQMVSLNYSTGFSAFQLTTDKNGSGGYTPLQLCTGGSANCGGWQISAGSTPGNLFPISQNTTPDIGSISNGQVRNLFLNGAAVNSGTYVIAYTNDATGTQVGKTAKRSSSVDANLNLEATIATTADTTNLLGVVVGESTGGTCGVGSNCTTGVAYVAFQGHTTAAFDGSTTAKHWAIASTTTAGDLSDSGIACGGTAPSAVDIAGCIQGTNTGSGSYAVDLTWVPAGGGAGVPAGVAAGSALVSDGVGIPPAYQTKPVYDARDYGFVCDGTTDNSTAVAALLAAVGTNQASVLIPNNCALRSVVWPANLTLDFSDGGSIKPLTDTTPAGGGAFDASGSGQCQSAGASTTCAITVTPSAANESYVLGCMYGFSSGNPATPTSSIAADNVLFMTQTPTSQHSITESWLVPNVSAGARTFTITFPSNLVGACSALAVSGLGPTPWLDGTGSYSTGTGTPMTSGAATFQSGSFLIGFGGQNSNAETCTAGAGFTQPAGLVGNSTAAGSALCTEYEASSSAGATTATQTLSSTPTTNAWYYQIIGLRPASGREQILGGINNPDDHQIFVNSTGTAGYIDFTGNASPFTVKPEWWGASSTAAASTNTPALQASIYGAFGQNRINGSGLNKYNKTLLLQGNYQINDELKLYDVLNFKVDCSGRLVNGITQTVSNKRIFDGQSVAYGKFNDCTWAGAAASTAPLIDLDWNGTATPNDLKPQFIDFYNNTFVGNNLVDTGVLIAKSGGAAQGSNIYCYDCEANSFTGAAWQVGGNNSGRNVGRLYAQNALAIGWYGGDIQGSPLYGFANYGGGYITIYGTSFENGFSTQTGYDMYCEATQGPCIMEHVRSESRRLAAGSTLVITDSRTINQATYMTPGSSYPVGTIIGGSTPGWNGHYYKVTVDASATGGVGTPSAPQYATSGSSTTIANVNYLTTGSVTSGTCTVGETMTQATSLATATLVAINSGMWTGTPTGVPDATHTWTGGTSACVFTPTGSPTQTNYTVNAFVGYQATILSGSGIGHYCVVTSNTATVITCSGGWLTYYASLPAVNPDATSTFVVEPNWGTQTVAGGITFADLNENGIDGAPAGNPSTAVLNYVDVPGDKIYATNTSTLKRVTVSRSDWMYSATDPLYSNFLSGDLDVRFSSQYQIQTSAGLQYQKSWAFPKVVQAGQVQYSGAQQRNFGTRPLVWSVGNNTYQADDVWIGGRSDPNSSADHTRAILEFGGMLGRATAIGTDQAGTDTPITGGPSTGAGTGGAVAFYNSVPSASGSTTNSGAESASITRGTNGGCLNLFGMTSGSASVCAPAVAGTVTNGLALSNSLFAPSGSSTNPSYSFASDTGVGMYDVGSSQLGFYGNNINLFTGGHVLNFQLASTGNFRFTGSKGQHIQPSAANGDIAGTCTLAATTCTVTFTTAYTVAPVCTANDQTAAAPIQSAPTTANVVFTGGTGAGATDVVGYHCIGNPN